MKIWAFAPGEGMCYYHCPQIALTLTKIFSFFSSSLDGLTPSAICILSLLFITNSYLKSKRRVMLNIADHKNDNVIYEAENEVIGKRVNDAGLSWGGLSLLRYSRGTQAHTSVHTPLPKGQVRKNFIVLFLSIAILGLHIARFVVADVLGSFLE